MFFHGEKCEMPKVKLQNQSESVICGRGFLSLRFKKRHLDIYGTIPFLLGYFTDT